MDASPSTRSRSEVLASLRHTMSLMWAESDSYTRRKLIISFALLLATSLLAAAAPVAYKSLIDGFAGTPPHLGSLVPSSLALVVLYVGCQYAIRVCGDVRTYVHGTALQRLNRRLTQRVFAHIMSLPLPYHLSRRTGAVGDTIGQGLTGCNILLQHLVFTFLPVALEFLAIVVILIQLGHADYLLLLGGSGCAYLIAFSIGTKRIKAPAEHASEAHIEASATLTDSLLNYETVKYFNGEARVAADFGRSVESTETSWKRLLRFQLSNGLALTTIFGVSLGAAISYTATQVSAGKLTVGDFVLINSYVIRLIQPLEAIGFAMRDMAQGLAFLKKLLELFNEAPENLLPCDTTPIKSPVRGAVTFDNVSFGYSTDQPLLRDISFALAPGSSLAIVGESGSGKSSIIRLLFGLYRPNRGRILLDDQPAEELSLRMIRDVISVVPQDTVLFNDTIARNIAFGRTSATRAEIERAVDLAHLRNFVDRLPRGLDTMVGERGLKLSGGERQRIAIARAALKNPKIYVFDEATSSLDSRTETEILANLREVSEGCTTLTVAHRLSTVVYADEILVLHQGVIAERGTHEDLLSAAGIYAHLWRTQMGSKPAANVAHVRAAG